MTKSYDIVIVGAGVTGVSLAMALGRVLPRRSVAVLEKEVAVARHASGRNSGVIHGGYNPKPGTKKARFCVEGSRRLKSFCSEHNVPWRAPGVLVTARSGSELGTVEELLRRGTENGVEGLQILDQAELRSREPRVMGLGALLAPSVGAVDSYGYVNAMRIVAEEAGVEFVFGCRVVGVDVAPDMQTLRTSLGQVSCKYLVNCAGLYADQIATPFGIGRDYFILPFRGEYFSVKREKSNWVRHMVYPVPDLEFPFLGIHWTPTVGGGLKLGPNVVLAFGREAYNFWDVHFGETFRALTGPAFRNMFGVNPKFRNFAWRFLKTSLSKSAFIEEASSLVEGLSREDLERGPPPGNRAQLVTREGKLVDDLIVEAHQNSLHVLNVVSPGLTCSIPFGEYLAQLVGEAIA